MWWMERERGTLTGLGIMALIGLGVLAWTQHRPPMVVQGAPSPEQTAQWDQALTVARQVDINTAGAAELERLPGIGPGLAQRIVEDRARVGRFEHPEDLSRVKGIGPKTYETLQEDIAVTTR